MTSLEATLLLLLFVVAVVAVYLGWASYEAHLSTRHLVNPEGDVHRFHVTYNAAAPGRPELPDPDVYALRLALIQEELDELDDAWLDGDLTAYADAVADLAYVVVGAAVDAGLPFNALWREVQRSNMSKLGADGQPIFRDDGKVLKGPNFRPPALTPIIAAAENGDYPWPRHPSLSATTRQPTG